MNTTTFPQNFCPTVTSENKTRADKYIIIVRQICQLLLMIIPTLVRDMFQSSQMLGFVVVEELRRTDLYLVRKIKLFLFPK